jgi:SanA protein
MHSLGKLRDWLARHRRVRIAAGVAVATATLGALGIAVPNAWMLLAARPVMHDTPDSVPQAQAAVVFGALVLRDGTLSSVTRDRVDAGVALYKAGRVGKLLISGDHGRTGYDEVNAMRSHALAAGVPPEDIFMDHAGFSTYDTVARARRVFRVESAVLVTQRFHLPRALWLARRCGIDASGFEANQRPYRTGRRMALREAAARVKDFAKGLVRPDPTFLGDPLPITGDGRCTVD